MPLPTSKGSSTTAAAVAAAAVAVPAAALAAALAATALYISKEIQGKFPGNKLVPGWK